MKKYFILLFLLFIIINSNSSIAETYRIPSKNIYGSVKPHTQYAEYDLNEYALYQYYLASYGDPSLYPSNKFTPSISGWMTRTNTSSEKGEYQYLGYTYNTLPLTNDRWFGTNGKIGQVFNINYSGVQWLDVTNVQGKQVFPTTKWQNLAIDDFASSQYIRNAPFFDSDHPTKGETPTGFTLATLLPNNLHMTKSYLLSMPTQYEDGAVYLRYTQDGHTDYNTIQIPALPRVECIMSASPNINKVERGKTADVIVTIDTRNSYALVYHEQQKSEISKRTYWAVSGSITDGDVGKVSTNGLYTITVPNVAPNTSIEVRATVFSQTVSDMKQPATDTATVTIPIGEIEPEAITDDTFTGTLLDASAQVIVKADSRDHEKYDVSQGIPTSETLYAQILAREYLIKQAFNQVSGNITYHVTVTHPEIPSSENGSGTDTGISTGTGTTDAASPPPLTTSVVTVIRPYSFWEISNLEVFQLDSSTIKNTSLPNGTLTIRPSSSYNKPDIDLIHPTNALLSYHLQTGNLSRQASTDSALAADIKQAAEAVIPSILVKNDKLVINNKTILSGSPSPVTGIPPVPANPGFISRDILYKSGLVIPNNILNGTYPTSASLRYTRLSGAIDPSHQTFIEHVVPSANTNAVTVHTPVSLTAGLVSDEAHNQSVTLDTSRGSIVLGRPFAIELSNFGRHLPIKGYGERDYTGYIKNRQFRLSFDAYYGELYGDQYLKAGIWHNVTSLNIPVSANRLELYVPTWVETGNHTIEVKTIALNDSYNGNKTAEIVAKTGFELAGITTNGVLGNSTYSSTVSRRSTVAGSANITGFVEYGSVSNLSPNEHAATVTIPVTVVGRLYDFQITDLEDPMWETFFHTAKGSAASTGKRFVTGTRNINGDIDSGRTDILPVMPGKNTQSGYQDRAVKLGYGLKFEIKTLGDFYHQNDAVRVHPEFYYLDKNGHNRQEVDLYYSLPNQPFIKVGSEQDSTIWNGKINLAYRNLTKKEWLDTGITNWQLNGQIEGYSNESVYSNAFLTNAQALNPMFKNWRIVLNQITRTFRGPNGINLPDSINSSVAHASMQKWYGEYRLPPDTLITPVGTDLSKIPRITSSNPIFLKEGYLIVNFRNIEVIQFGHFDNPTLFYSGRDMNNSLMNHPKEPGQADVSLIDKGSAWLMEGVPNTQSVVTKNGIPVGSNITGSGTTGNDVTNTVWDLREGDILAYYAGKRSTDDVQGLGTH